AGASAAAAGPSRLPLAACAIGTNSIKLLVGAVDGQKVTPLLHRSMITRLGEGLQRTGEISDEAADRTAAALAELGTLARERGAEKIRAVGTLALRAAKNGRAFADRVAREAGLEIRILTGEEEARLSFQGA